MGKRRYIPASEFCASVRDGTHDSPKPVEQGRKLVTSRHLTTGNLDLSDAYLISEGDFEHINGHSKVDKWDVLISMIGTVGKPCLIKEEPDFAIKNIGLFKTKSETDGKWLYYYFRSKAAQNSIREQSRGTTQQYIPLAALRDFPVLVTDDLEERKAIAHILGTLDDKIELNHRMNETLEAMARALFKSWFVDFDPVRAKMECRDTGWPKDIADLFPDRFEESELGDVPQGWSVASIGEVSEVVDCLHSRKPSRTAEGKPLIQLWNIRDDGLTDMSDTYFIDEADYERWTSRIEVREGDCVITNVGRVGAVSQIPPGLDAALGRNMTGVRCVDGFSYPTFLIEVLLSDAMRWEIDIKTDSGTILNALNVRNIPKLRFVRAPETVLAVYERIARPTRARMEANLEASCTLAALRDALLPKLVSGELRVNAREAMRGDGNRSVPAIEAGT